MLLLLPEVDEAVGGLGDGSERPYGGVADPDCPSVSTPILLLLLQQIDDVAEADRCVVLIGLLIRTCVCVCVLTQVGVWIRSASPLRSPGSLIGPEPTAGFPSETSEHRLFCRGIRV